MSLADVPGTAIGLEIGLGLAAAVVAHRVAVSRQNARIREGYPLLDSAWRAMTRRTRVRAARSIRRGNPNLDARSAAGLAAVLLSLRAREAASGTSNTRVVIKSCTPLLFVSALALLAVL